MISGRRLRSAEPLKQTTQYMQETRASIKYIQYVSTIDR